MARVLVPLADGCEELEAVALIDLLRRAGFDVVAAGLQVGPIQTSRGVRLWPDTSLDHVVDRSFDLIALPGGTAGAARLTAHPGLAALLTQHRAVDGWVAAIGAGPAVLAARGLLGARRATASPGALEAHGIASSGTALEIDGRVITAQGPGTAIDFALMLIEALAGRERRDSVEEGLRA